MKRILATALCLSSVVFSGCESSSQPKPGANTGGNSTSTSNANAAQMPKTEKADGDYVASETGTEKAKPEAGKANVQGKVLFNEKPVEGVEVKLCETFSRFMGGCSGENFKTKTDSNGEYLFGGVTPKVYEGLLVKVFDTKNYIFATQGLGISSAKYKFNPDETFFAPDTNLFKDDLKILSPQKNARADAKNLEIKWEAYPDAAYYKLTLSPKNYDAASSVAEDRIEAASYKVEKSLKSGEYALRLSAYNANDVKLAEIIGVSFNVTGEDAAPADTAKP